MDTNTRFYVGNLEALIGAVESASVEAIGLGGQAVDQAGWYPSFLCAMLVQLPQFVRLGIDRLSESDRLPRMRLSSGQILGVGETLDYLFGRFDSWGAYELLFAPAGVGVRDDVLTGWSVEPCSHRELALCRLYFAYEHVTRKSYRAAPAVDTDIVRAVVQARLCECGWRRRNGTGIADKVFATAVGPKVANAYFAGPDPFAFALRGDYWSERSNILEASSALIPRAASTDTVLRLVDGFVVRVDKTVADSYAVRLLKPT